LVRETIIADGGSSDETVRIAGSAGATVIAAPKGRGTQLAQGARAATGDWLMFLHADSVPVPGWAERLSEFIAEPLNQDRAAVFQFATDIQGRLARRMERNVAWRSRVLGLPYGDQGLVISRDAYDAVGGYRDIPIMEDVDLVRRIGRQHLTMLNATMMTSGVRYRRHGIIGRSARNLTCLGMYFLGVSPRLIARLYG
jgi:rSAM/selenodomain-associated transferase 2